MNPDTSRKAPPMAEVNDVVAEWTAAMEGVTPFRDEDVIRYEHGGGRIAIMRDGERTLVADLYQEADREFFARCSPGGIRSLLDLIADQAARLEENERVIAEVNAQLTKEIACSGSLANRLLKSWEALTAAEVEKERYRDALEPFAREADARSSLVLGPDIDGWPIGGSALTLGDLRRARAALSPKKEQGA